MEKPFEKPLLTTQEVAQFCGFSASTVAFWARIGNIDGTKIGGRWRFDERDVHEFLGDRGAATDTHVQACFKRWAAKNRGRA